MVHQTSEHVDVGTTNCGKIVKDGVEISLQKKKKTEKQKNNNNHSDQKKKKKEESEKV
jgi:hypothetical protein